MTNRRERQAEKHHEEENVAPLVHWLADDLFEVSGQRFKILVDYREAFKDKAFSNLFQNDIFKKYDYLVGDIAFDLLKLKGFYQNDCRRIKEDSKIKYLDDYLIEYVNFDAPYYILERIWDTEALEHREAIIKEHDEARKNKARPRKKNNKRPRTRNNVKQTDTKTVKQNKPKQERTNKQTSRNQNKRKSTPRSDSNKKWAQQDNSQQARNQNPKTAERQPRSKQGQSNQKPRTHAFVIKDKGEE